MILKVVRAIILMCDYCCVITGISKSEAIDLIQNIDLAGKSEKNIKIYEK